MPEIIKPKMMEYKRHLIICIGSRCTPNGEGQALYDELKEKLKAAGVDKGELRVKRSRATCFGTCKSGPLLCVQPDGIWYYDINRINYVIMKPKHLKKSIFEILMSHRHIL